MRFNNVIVKIPCPEMVNGISNSDLGKPDYEKALKQHERYIETLKSCDVNVTILEADSDFPDSTFIEDAALLTRKCAILTNPGAPSRNGEPIRIKKTLEKFYANIESIKGSATIDAGDIMMVGDHFYIGLSERTNQAGAETMIAILEKYGLTGSIYPVKEVLHLKTGISYIENNIMMASGEFLVSEEFKKYDLLEIPEDESYAGNSIWINDTVITPAGYPKTRALLEEQTDYKIVAVDMSEFRKLDGGLSCLSLRF